MGNKQGKSRRSKKDGKMLDLESLEFSPVSASSSSGASSSSSGASSSRTTSPEFDWALEKLDLLEQAPDKATVKKLFAKYDTDKSGVLEKDEATAMFTDFAKSTLEGSDETEISKIVEALWNHLDKDGDGNVTVGEILGWKWANSIGKNELCFDPPKKLGGKGNELPPLTSTAYSGEESEHGGVSDLAKSRVESTAEGETIVFASMRYGGIRKISVNEAGNVKELEAAIQLPDFSVLVFKDKELGDRKLTYTGVAELNSGHLAIGIEGDYLKYGVVIVTHDGSAVVRTIDFGNPEHIGKPEEGMAYGGEELGGMEVDEATGNLVLHLFAKGGYSHKHTASRLVSIHLPEEHEGGSAEDPVSVQVNVFARHQAEGIYPDNCALAVDALNRVAYIAAHNTLFGIDLEEGVLCDRDPYYEVCDVPLKEQWHFSEKIKYTLGVHPSYFALDVCSDGSLLGGYDDTKGYRDTWSLLRHLQGPVSFRSSETDFAKLPSIAKTTKTAGLRISDSVYLWAMGHWQTAKLESEYVFPTPEVMELMHHYNIKGKV